MQCGSGADLDERLTCESSTSNLQSLDACRTHDQTTAAGRDANGDSRFYLVISPWLPHRSPLLAPLLLVAFAATLRELADGVLRRGKGSFRHQTAVVMARIRCQLTKRAAFRAKASEAMARAGVRTKASSKAFLTASISLSSLVTADCSGISPAAPCLAGCSGDLGARPCAMWNGKVQGVMETKESTLCSEEAQEIRFTRASVCQDSG